MNTTKEKQIHLLDGMLEAVKAEELRREKFKAEAEKIAEGLGFGINWRTYEKGPLFPVTCGQTWQCINFPAIKTNIVSCENTDKIEVMMSYQGVYGARTFLSLDHLQTRFRLSHDPRRVSQPKSESK